MTSVYRKNERMSYAAIESVDPEFPDVTLVTLSSGEDFSVSFATNAGMVGTSLRHRGEELLGQRGGLGPYRDAGKTFGIPLLAPWANRLAVTEFEGTQLTLDGTPHVHPDENRLPIHGLLAGSPDWEVTVCEAVEDGEEAGAWLVAQLEFGPERVDFAAFPFEHRLEVAVHVVGHSVSITTSIAATGDQVVPVAFGWHPYFSPPGADRQDWTLSKPFTHHVELDERNVPTGEVVREPVDVVVLGDPADGGHTFDDLYCDVAEGTQAWLDGGRRRITVSYDNGYPFAVLYAPAGDSLVAIEPMTAATDPLSGHFTLNTVADDATYSAQFSIIVTDEGTQA